jgi:predicted TPR repeat methyltransferase
MTPNELAKSHVARGEWNEAARCYREASAATPRDPGPCIGLAFALMQLGENAAAREALQTAIGIDPTQADAHYLIGQIARGSGETGAAASYFRDAIRHNAVFAEAHRDLIQLLVDTNPREALVAATRAVEAFPESAEFWFYRGATSEKAGHRDRAIACYEQACALQPDALQARRNLARTLAESKRHADAIPHCQALIALAPDDADAHMMLGAAHLEAGNVEAAVASYSRSRDIKPNETIDYVIASLTGKTVDRAPDDYVAYLFDGYAANFDTHLVGRLKYSVPTQLAEMLARVCAKPMGDVLDLGCGTGLMGAELENSASTIVGVDLSEKMLDKARERKVYSRLERADLAAMMTGEPDGGYGVIVAADVFVYVGKLDELFEQAYRLLRPSGIFAFSVEAATPATTQAAAETGYVLHREGRYVHTKEYLQRLGATVGFQAVELRETVGREHNDTPVQAFLAAFRHP